MVKEYVNFNSLPHLSKIKIVKRAETIPIGVKRFGYDRVSAKAGKLFLSPANPWVRLVKKHFFKELNSISGEDCKMEKEEMNFKFLASPTEKNDSKMC